MCFYDLFLFFFFEYRLSINIFFVPLDYTRNWHSVMKKGALHRSIIGWTFIFNRATRASRQCEKALRCRDWWGKILFRKCFVWYRKEDGCVGRNVGTSGIMEMGRMCVMVIRKKRLEFFITLYQGFLAFWSVVSCNTEMELLFEIKIIKVEQDNLCIVGLRKSLWKLIGKIYIFFIH